MEFFYNAKTLFYEIGTDNKPVKHSDILGDNHGDLLHIGIRDGQYNVCYYIFIGEQEIEECITGQKLLLKALNTGTMQPIESDVDIEKIFSSLSESISDTLESYQPKLYLRFEPPIYNDNVGIRQLDKILNLIEDEYPTVSWWMGQEPSEYNPFVHNEEEDITDQVKAITIGYWPSEPNRLTYGMWDDNDGNYTNAIDGWSWLEERQVDFDKTFDILDSLNESDESRIPSAGDYLIFVGDMGHNRRWLEARFTVGKVYKVLHTTEDTIEVQNDLVDYLGSGSSNFSIHLLDGLNWETWFRLAKFDYDKTTDIFNQLNESVYQYQPKLNLRFEDGISDADELDKVLRVLEIVYPGLQWKGGSPISSHNVIRDEDDVYEDFIYEPIVYLTIGFFANSPDKLTYTSGPVDDISFADDEHYNYDWVDGWQWVQENDVDYDETSDIFNQLNESVQNYEPYTIIFDPPIEDPKTMEMVLMKLQTIHPDWTWVNSKRLIDYNPFDNEIQYDRYDGMYDSVVGNLTLNHPEWKHTKGLSWGSGDPDEPYFADVPKYNGWEYVENLGDIPSTEDIFNQLD